LRLDPLTSEAMERLLSIYLPEPSADERGRLVTVAEGSPGRALMLAQDDGLKIAGLVDEVLAALPELKPAKAYAVADGLTRGDTAFSNFFDLLRAGIAAAVRDVAKGQGDEEQSRLVGLRPLDAWGDVWHALTRLQDETERFNLDKRQAIVAGLGMLGGKQS
jgi:DNA polymerase III subunit delta'